MKVFYHPLFGINIASIVGADRYMLARNSAIYQNVCRKQEILSPEPLTKEEVLAIHDLEYVEAVETGIPSMLAQTNSFRWKPELFQSVCLTNGGVYGALKQALSDGSSGVLASGFHHAEKERGGGYCTFNFMTAIHKLQSEQDISVLIVDTDVHYPNGTLDCIEGLNNVFLLSLYANSCGVEKASNSVLVGVTDELGAGNYLRLLHEHLEDAITRFKPGIVLYHAGQDALVGDPLGDLNLTAEDLFKRDSIIFQTASRSCIPSAFTFGGGYSQPVHKIVQGNVNTMKAAKSAYNN